MSNEITCRAILSFLKSGVDAKLELPATTFDMTGSDYASGTLTATTDETALALPGSQTEGWLMIVNHSTDTTVLVGTSGGAHNYGAAPGGVFIGYCGNAGITYRTASGSAIFEFLLLEA